jgi:lipopolysaccharide biosynthesis glycosyltransferase
MSPFVKDYDFFISRHVTAETYSRLFIPYMFSNIDKAIYLDGDMVCLTDISELFDFDVSNYLVGGVRDVGIAWYFLPKKYKTNTDKKIYEYLSSLENPSGYINAGMLLINCERFREAYSQKNVIDTVFSRKWQVHDQDVINFLSKDKILHLDYEWDYINMPNNYVRYLPQNLKEKYIAAKKNPKIIHYKPYDVWYYTQYFYEFWKYATRTPFIKEIVERMDKSGFLDENLGNKVCIAVRTRTGIGGFVILKAVLAFFTKK